MLELDTIHNLDATAFLQQCEPDSVHCMVTSPPYWGLRDYGVPGQMGLEPTLEAFLEGMVELFREARRVLHPMGTLWVNMGDSYAARMRQSGPEYAGEMTRSSKGILVDGKRPLPIGLKEKDLIGQPWRLALALQADGWWLRSDIIWHKKNPLPESVTDRPTKSHEHIFLLTKQPRYFYDAEAVRENVGNPTRRTNGMRSPDFLEGKSFYNKSTGGWDNYNETTTTSGRNKRDVWTVATQAQPEAHFATFPEKLIEPCILAGCPPKVCETCGIPHVRVVEKDTFDRTQDRLYVKGHNNPSGKVPGSNTRGMPNGNPRSLGWQPQCECEAGTQPGIVMDFFMGSGTVAKVAIQHGRRWIGCELNPEYIEIAERRLNKGVNVDMFTSAGLDV
jgi:DNA modification methylase